MKEKLTLFSEEQYDDLDDNIGIVMPVLTDCEADDDFSQGMDSMDSQIPILPLRNMVLFPAVAMPVMVGRAKSMKLVKEAYKEKKLIGVVCQKDVNQNDPGQDDLYKVGVIAEIMRILEMPDGTTTVILQGKKRFPWIQLALPILI